MVYFGKDAKVKEGDVVSEIPPFAIRFTNQLFSLQNLYVTMHELLLEEGWLGFENESADVFSHSDLEALYSENVYQKGIHGGGKEYWVWWRAQKQLERPNSYFLNVLDIDWYCAKTQESEIVHQGKKMKVHIGDLQMFFKARIMSDVGYNWERHRLLKHFKHIYEARIMPSHIQKREKELWRDVYRLQSKVKSYLNLRTWMPTPELFHPKLYGWESPEQV